MSTLNHIWMQKIKKEQAQMGTASVDKSFCYFLSVQTSTFWKCIMPQKRNNSVLIALHPNSTINFS